MQRLLSIRVVRWEMKLAYVIGVWLVGYPLSALLAALGVPEVASLLISSVVLIMVVLLGARIFRGRGEPIESARPWWKMTARPTLSRRLGILFAFGTATGILFVIIAVFGLDYPGRYSPPTLAMAVDSFWSYGVLTFLYLNSAVRLKQAGVAPPEPRLRPKVNLE